MVQGLLVVLIVQVGLAKLSVGLYQNEKLFSVDINENFAYSQLLNPHLDLPIQILAHEKLIQLLVFFN